MPKFNPDTEEIEISHEEKAREKNDRSGRGKFAAEVQKGMQRDDRTQVEKRQRQLAPTGKDEERGIEYLKGRTFVAQCHVCQHPHRDWIEMMLIKGASYKGLQDRVPPLAGHNILDRRSLSNHHKKHMDLEDSMIRAILEREATLAQQDFEEGLEDAVTKRGVLEVALRKGYDDLVNGVTTVEPRDLIQIAKVLGDMDTHQSQVGLDEARAQVQIFIQAIKNVCDADIQSEIANEVKRLRSRESITTQYESVMEAPPSITAAKEAYIAGEIEVGELEDEIEEAIVVEDSSSR